MRALLSSKTDGKTYLIPAALLVLYIAQCGWFIATQSLTYDEPVHIAEGLDAWRNGRFEQYNDHPPLARLLVALPLIQGKWQIAVRQLPEGFRIPRISPDPISLAWRARSMNVLLGVILGILLWSEARKQFSTPGANFALALFAFSPSLIAHYSVATTDGAAALMIFAAAVQVRRCVICGSRINAALLGVVLGLLLLAKYSTLPMFALACAWFLVVVRGRIPVRPWEWKWAQLTLVILIAYGVVWTGYFFHVSRLTIHNGTLTVSHPLWTATLIKPTRVRFNLSLSIPAGEYVAGLRDLAFHNARGQRAFFLGQVSSTGGWKGYYPVAILLKWPILVMLSFLGGLLAIGIRKVQAPRGMWLFCSFPILYFSLSIFARFNIGERHVLPVYPFGLVLAAAAADYVRQQRWGVLLLFCVLLGNAADVVRYAPGYLSYMNLGVSPDAGYKLLSDSNLDWGQGLLAVRRYQDLHPNQRIALAYFGSVEPEVYGINARAVGENEAVVGTVIVGATQLSGQYLKDPAGYRWLLDHRLEKVLDHCTYVFSVDQ